MAVKALKFGSVNKSLTAFTSRWLAKNSRSLVALYKDLHAHPELSQHEKRTAGIVADRFRRTGLKVAERIGGHGVVGVLANGRGPVIMIRGDMDALPITEETRLPYASRVPGAMHACGHDVHTSALTAVASIFAAAKSAWRGTILFIAQPAEEVTCGADAMIADGLFKRFPRPAAVLALHVASQLHSAQLGYTPGWAAANVDSVNVTMLGRGGHGASPHECQDPIVAAAYFITALQTIVTRRIDPTQPSVITVGSIHAGTKHNIISDRAEMLLTVRTYSADVRNKVLASIRSVAADAARIAGLTKHPIVKTNVEATDAVYNDPDLARHAASIFASIVGPKNVVVEPPTMGGEDFSAYVTALGVPGLIYSVGSVSRKAVLSARGADRSPLPPLHNARYFPIPDPTLKLSVRSMTTLAGSLLSRP